MVETKNQGKATMIQFAARPRKNIFIAAEAGTAAEIPVKIPVKKSIRDGLKTPKIGEYFKVKNDKPWKYYRKTSAKGAKKIKEAEFTDGPIKTSIRNGLETLEIGEYFKVKNGDESRYYKISSAKGVTKTTEDQILKEMEMAKKKEMAKNNNDEETDKKAATNTRTTTVTALETLAGEEAATTTTVTALETLADEEAATTTTVDFMKGEITASDVPSYIQNRDMIAVEKNTKFCASQLLDTARIFKSLVGYQRVRGIVTNSTGTYKDMEADMPYLLNQTENDNGTYYHHRATIGEFIRIFDGIEVNMSPNGGLSTPPLSHTMTFKTQKHIKRGRSIIYINDLKKNVYSFLMSKTRTVDGRNKKLKSIQNKKEGLLLLVIACSIGLPTRKFTNAYGFFEIFAKKHTIVNDSNIIRTLLHLNGIYVNGVREYGNRALELWEIYKKEFPHFKTTYDDDDDNIKTLYSYPTATELRYLVIRAEKVIENILDGEDLVQAVEQVGNVDGGTLTNPVTVEQQPGQLERQRTEEQETKTKEKQSPRQTTVVQQETNLSAKKPINFLLSI